MIQFLYSNLFDSATVTSSSQVSSTYAGSNVQDRFLKKVWRATGATSEWIKFDLGSPQSVSMFTFFANNFTTSAMITLYGHASDLGTNISTWDSTATYKQTISSFDQTVGILSLSQTFQWWVLGIKDNTNSSGYIQLGRVYAGVPSAPSENFNETFTEPNVDPSQTFWTQGQHQYAVQRPQYKSFEITFSEISAANQTILRNLWTSVGKIQPFVLILDYDQNPLTLTRYGVWNSDMSFQWTVNQRVNCNMIFRELK